MALLLLAWRAGWLAPILILFAATKKLAYIFEEVSILVNPSLPQKQQQDIMKCHRNASLMVGVWYVGLSLEGW